MKHKIVILLFVFISMNLFSQKNLIEYNDIPGNWDNKYNLIPKDMLHKETVLLGQVVDTGVLNLFFFNRFDGTQVIPKRIYFDRRALTPVEPYSWHEVKGYYTSVENDKETFKVLEAALLNQNLRLKLAEAAAAVEKAFAGVKGVLDLNRLKKFSKVKAFLQEHQINPADFRKIEVEKLNQLVFIDEAAGLCGIIAGNALLAEKGRVSLHVQFLALYHLKEKKVIKIKALPYERFVRD